MPDVDPNLIPPPSIGESHAGAPAGASQPRKKGSMLWLVVLICVVVGVGAGVVVYQQSIAPAPVATPRPSVAPKPSPTAAVPQVSQVTPQSNDLVMPQAGEVRIYLSGFNVNDPAMPNQLVRLTTLNGQADLIAPATLPAGDKMHIFDSGLEVAAGETLNIKIFDGGDETQQAYGWAKPTANNMCGATTTVDASVFVNWATQESEGQPIVAVQCWGDYAPPGDSSGADYNDYLAIVSYVPASQMTATTTTSTTTTTTASSSPAVTSTSTPTPTPTPTATPDTTSYTSTTDTSTTTTDTTTDTSDTTTDTTRATMPEGSALPVAGVFEVTVGTVGLGLLFVVAGALGLIFL